MTSNIGSEEFNEKAAQIGFTISEKEEEKIIADYDNIRTKVLKQLPEVFSPEFLNRIDKTIVFSPLDKKVLKRIISLQLEDLVIRLKWIWVALTYDTKAQNSILEETYNPEYWARPVRRFIQDALEDVVADMMIRDAKKKAVAVSAVKWKLTFTWK